MCFSDFSSAFCSSVTVNLEVGCCATSEYGVHPANNKTIPIRQLICRNIRLRLFDEHASFKSVHYGMEINF